MGPTFFKCFLLMIWIGMIYRRSLLIGQLCRITTSCCSWWTFAAFSLQHITVVVYDNFVTRCTEICVDFRVRLWVTGVFYQKSSEIVCCEMFDGIFTCRAFVNSSSSLRDRLSSRYIFLLTYLPTFLLKWLEHHVISSNAAYMYSIYVSVWHRFLMIMPTKADSLSSARV